MFNTIMGLLLIMTLGYWMWMIVESIRGLSLFHALPPHHTLKPHNKDCESKVDTPLVSVIIAAKEEEASITDTVNHLLAQDYSRIELIVINDRSNDQTGHKLEQLKKWSEAKQSIHIPLKIIHVTSLPSHWLGKNHALYQGYKQAKGAYLLFTDADIMYEPTTISDAVRYMQNNDVDHLALMPSMVTKQPFLRLFVNYFFFSFNLFFQPWKANNDNQTRRGMGIGAFNMVKRDVYEKVGTHKAIAVRPDDDLQLGQVIKRHGYKQRYLDGRNHLSVEWYTSLNEAVKGLEKNTFAGLHYKLWMVFGAWFGQFFAFLFPFIAIFIFEQWLAIGFLIVVFMIVGTYLAHARQFNAHRLAGLEVVFFPIMALFFLFVVFRSIVITLKQNGIYWRGTFYSLKTLKKMQDVPTNTHQLRQTRRRGDEDK